MTKVTAKIYHADTPNANGLMYTKESLENAIEHYNVSDHNVVELGEYGTSFDVEGGIDLSKVVGRANLTMEDDFVVAKINMLDTLLATDVANRVASAAQPVSTRLLAMPQGIGIVGESSVVELQRIHKIVCTEEGSVDVGENPDDLFTITVDDND